MNRCFASFTGLPSRRALLRSALAAPLLAWAAMAAAQGLVRPFPATAERGVLRVIVPPVIEMGGKPDRLSPGARVHGLNNMLIMSGSIIGQSLLVNFVRNPTGEVHEVWVLTETEAALMLPTQALQSQQIQQSQPPRQP